MLNRLKQQIRIIESILTEGDHWPEDYRRKAINRIRLATDTSKYSDADIERDVNRMIAKFEPLSHKNSNLGYFLPIIRMFINDVGNDEKKRKEFLDSKIDMLVKTLGIISQDSSLEAKFKDDIKNRWSLEDFEKHAAELQDEIAKNDANTLTSVGNSPVSDYDIINIGSYEELHDKFGGDKTGYKGESEWCHSNGKSTYDSWTSNGTKQFFVLAKKGWENITPPDPKTTNAFDEYGTSLIAILVGVKDGELLRATLRWNHVIEPDETVPKTSVDRAFLGWGDLSKALGFNVKAVVEKEINVNQSDLKNKSEKVNKAVSDKLKTITEIDEDTIYPNYRRLLTHVEIPDNVTSIDSFSFENCSNLSSVTIPDSVTYIGDWAFYGCEALTQLTIPDTVTYIGTSTFAACYGLTNITIPNNVTKIGSNAFRNCSDLTNITIHNSVTSIGKYAFVGCDNLSSVIFTGKTMDEVRSMENYPWGIQHPEEVIRVTGASN